MKKMTLMALLLGVCVSTQAAEVKLAIAANFTKPMQDLAPVYEKMTGDKLVMSFGATGALYAQIKNGAPFDILLSADDKATVRAVTEGLGVEGSTFTYAIGKLVLWSKQADFVKDAKVLESEKVQKLAVADPKLAPYGVAAEETLRHLGLYEKLQPKFVIGGYIGKTYQFVSSENAQVGFIALSQCYKNGKFTEGSGWIVPAEYYNPIMQDGVLLTNGQNKEAAKKFIDFLKSSPEADKVREAFGYAMVK